MSDTEYQKAVAELFKTKAHRYNADEQRSMQKNTAFFLAALTRDAAPFPELQRRFQALQQRVQKLAVPQFTVALEAATHSYAMANTRRQDGKLILVPASADSLEGALVAITTEVALAERRPHE